MSLTVSGIANSIDLHVDVKLCVSELKLFEAITVCGPERMVAFKLKLPLPSTGTVVIREIVR